MNGDPAHEVEELKRQLEQADDADERIGILLELSRASRRTDTDSAREYAHEALRLGTASRRHAAMAAALTRIGFCDYVQRRFDEAIAHFERAHKFAERADATDEIARSMHGIACCQTERSMFVEAMSLLDNALDIASRGEFRRTEAMVLNSMGFIDMQLCSYTNALERFHSSLAILEDLGERYSTMLPLNNIGRILLSIKDHDAAEPYFIRVREIAEEIGAHGAIGLALANLGEVHNRRAQYDEALQCFEGATEIAIETGDKHRQAYAIASSAKVLLERGALEAARSQAECALEAAIAGESPIRANIRAFLGELLARTSPVEAVPVLEAACAGAIEIGERDVELRCNAKLSDCFEQLNDGMRALEHLRRADALREAIMGQQTQRTVAQMQMRDEIERSAREKVEMRAENERLSGEMREKANELTSMALQLVEKNEFLDSLRREMLNVAQAVYAPSVTAIKGLTRQVSRAIDSDDRWKMFDEQFDRVHHDFLRQLAQQCPELSRSELKVCALLKLNLATKEIATILSSSERTIGNHRYHIRKKLGLGEDVNLSGFFAQL